MRAEELKGHLDALLLATLEDGPRHGYAVIETLRQATGGRLNLPTGTIYPALRRLERAGLIARGREAQWRPCRIQGAALRDVDDWLAHYRRFWDESFDRLDDYLRKLQAKEKKRGRKQHKT